MVARSTYAKVTGDWPADVAALAERMVAYWGTDEDDALVLARREIEELRSEMADAPPVEEARRLFHSCREESYRRPRDRAASTAADNAHRRLLAAEVRQRLTGAAVDKPREAAIIDDILGAE